MQSAIGIELVAYELQAQNAYVDIIICIHISITYDILYYIHIYRLHNCLHILRTYTYQLLLLLCFSCSTHVRLDVPYPNS